MSDDRQALANGLFELPASARGVLFLKDPPEAGWGMQTHPHVEARTGPGPGAEADDVIDPRRARDLCAFEQRTRG